MSGRLENDSFKLLDTVVSMNGFHAFPDKQKAFHEIWRVLKPGGNFIACFYILVGFIARLIGKKLAFLKDMIFMMRRLSR